MDPDDYFRAPTEGVFLFSKTITFEDSGTSVTAEWLEVRDLPEFTALWNPGDPVDFH